MTVVIRRYASAAVGLILATAVPARAQGLAAGVTGSDSSAAWPAQGPTSAAS